jgi:two-component system nitrate/nitrite response regulator NarL
MSESITIVVADDHPMFREGVARTLAAASDFEVIGLASSADEALAQVEEHLPDIVLLDVSMPGGGIAITARICERFPVVKVVMLTVSEDADVVRRALRSGAHGYILKGVSGPDLITILRNVHAGQPYITPALAALMLRSVEADARRDDPLDVLTEREREILKQLANGSSNKTIAKALSIGERTVKHHMTNILQKLQVRNRVEAALVAQRNQDPR